MQKSKKYIKKRNGFYWPTKEMKKIAWLNQKGIYKKALKDPLGFWEAAAKELKWHKKWSKVFSLHPPKTSKSVAPSKKDLDKRYFEWFSGGKINITENCLDENLKTRKHKIALIWEPEPVGESSRVFTYEQLYRQVNKFANALKKLGVKKGDRVGIYLPMIPEAIVAMLAAARIGAVHTVVFSAFSPQALKIRLQDTGAKVLITADGYFRRGKVIDLKKNADKALSDTKVKKVVVVQRAKNQVKMRKARDKWWHELIEKQSDWCVPEIMDSEDLLFILYTSGCCHKDTFIQLDTGEIKKIYDLVEHGGSNLINTNLEKLKQNVEPIINKFKYSWTGPLWKIQTSLSLLKITPNHPLFVLTENGEIIEKQASDIRVGEHILQSRKINIVGKRQKMPEVNVLYQERKCNENRSNKPAIPKFLTVDLAQILGYFTGDGGLSDVNIHLTDKDKNNLIFYQKLFKKELQVRGLIRHYTRQRLKVHSAFLSRYLKNAFPEICTDSYHREVPKIIQRSPNKVVAAFIKGLFDAEGSVSDGVARITSQSRDLIEVLRMLLLRFGIVANYFEEERETHFPDGSHYNILVHGIRITDRKSLLLFQQEIGFSDLRKSKKLGNLLKALSKKRIVSMIDQLPINGLLRLLRDTIMIPKAEAKLFHLASYIYSKRRIKQNRIHLVHGYVDEKIQLIKGLDFSQRNGIRRGISIFKLSHNDLSKVTGKSKNTVHQYHCRKKPFVKEETIRKFYIPITKHLVDLRKDKLKALIKISKTLKKINDLDGFDFFEVKKSEPVENDFGFVYDLEALNNHNYLANGVVVHNSTGRPKGTMSACGGYAVQAKATGKYIFDWKENDIFWSTADVGWITGHTYSCYAPLLNGTIFLIFEGSPDWPTPDRWAQIIEKYGVTIFYTAPTAIRMFEKYGTDLIKKYDFKTLRLLGSVGEPIDEAAWHWYFREVGKNRCPIVDTWWQTETGGILITSLPGIGPFKPSVAGLPFPGVRFDVFDAQGKPLPRGKEGNLVMLPPFCPGLLRGVYKNPEKYFKTYWSEYGPETYFTSDSAYKGKKGLIRIVGRVDDVIKVAGHRFTTGELESAISLHKDVTESAVVGIKDEIKGEVPVAFVVCKESKKAESQLQKEIVQQVRQEIGPIALLKEVYVVEDLPKTRSGKIMRRILRKLFTGKELGDLSTLANPQSVDALKKIIGK